MSPELAGVTRLEMASIAVIPACACVAGVTLSRKSQATPTAAPAYAVGDKIDVAAGVYFGTSSRSLLMALHEDCS